MEWRRWGQRSPRDPQTAGSVSMQPSMQRVGVKEWQTAGLQCSCSEIRRWANCQPPADSRGSFTLYDCTRATMARLSSSSLQRLLLPLPLLPRFHPAPANALTRSNTMMPASRSQQHRRSLSTINPSEVSHFANLAATWWDEQGDLNILQRMNKVRVEFLRERLQMAAVGANGSSSAECESQLDKLAGPKFLQGLKVLDVGCGGGLFAEVRRGASSNARESSRTEIYSCALQRLARLGATTVAIDASNENVQTATLHASQDPSLLRMLENGQLEYRHAAAEHLVDNDAQRGQFDIVCAMEVIEHVSDPPSFLRCLAELVKVS